MKHTTIIKTNVSIILDTSDKEASLENKVIGTRYRPRRKGVKSMAAFTRSWLKSRGYEDEQIEELISAHTEVTKALKSQISEAKDEVDNLKSEMGDISKVKEELKAAKNELKTTKEQLPVGCVKSFYKQLFFCSFILVVMLNQRYISYHYN